MELKDPKTWESPTDWRPDADANWEIECLKALALAIQEKDQDVKVDINLDDPNCIFFSAIRSELRIGEAYVNRKGANGSTPLFSVFYGRDEEELHSASVEECASKLVGSDGFPDE
ncbi:MAG: hypothetical protein AAF942_13200 [Pseudomonadota bacterium]